jgi:hypothetical protein
VGSSDKVERAHDELARLVEGLQSGEQWKAALAVAARLHAYSFGNCLLIAAQHSRAYAAGLVPDPVPDLVAGYRTWQSLGRQVMRGQHGYTILRPQMRSTRTAVAEDGTSRRLAPRERPAEAERVTASQTLVGWTTATVFALSQTEGPDLPRRPVPQLLEGQAPAGLWEGVARQLSAAGYSLERVPPARLGTANGETDFRARTVSVRDDVSDAAATKTVLHELGHVLLHDPLVRTGRLAEEDVGRGRAEVEAESFAFVLAAAHGMDTAGYSLPYVARWAGGENPAEVVRATAQRVTKAAQAVLARLDTDHSIGGHPLASDDAPAVTTQAEASPPARTASRRMPTQAAAGVGPD